MKRQEVIKKRRKIVWCKWTKGGASPLILCVAVMCRCRHTFLLCSFLCEWTKGTESHEDLIAPHRNRRPWIW